MAITKATASSVAPAAAGDLVYGSGTNDAAVLGIGTAGQVLQVNSGATAPEWATPAAGGGGMTQLATGSFSSTTTTISGISGSYKNLVVVIRDVGNATGGDTLMMRFNNVSTGNYGRRVFSDTNTAGAVTSTSFDLGYHYDAADSFGYVQIFDYANTGTHKIQNTFLFSQDGATNYNMMNSWGVLKDTSAVTELNFFWNAGYTFDAGTYIVYGVN